MVPFCRELYIEQEDFMENPPGKFFRLAPGREVRLRYAYLVTCTSVVRDDSGNIIEVRCTYDPDSRGGNAPDGRKVKGTIHWVSARHCRDAEVRVYQPLFADPEPKFSTDENLADILNPQSCEIIEEAKMEPALLGSPSGACFQFERLGYFNVDQDSSVEKTVFNRTVALRDTWARVKGK